MSPRVRITCRHVLALTGPMIGTAWLLDTGRQMASKASVPAVSGGFTLNVSDPSVVAFAIVWLVALLFAAYLVLLIVSSGVVRLFELPRATHLVERATPPSLRRLLGGMTALSVIAAPGHLHASERVTPIHAVAAISEPPDDGEATLHLLGANEQPTPSDAEAEPAPAAPFDSGSRSWTVEPGDSLWLIASSHLTDANGRAMTDAEIEPYWRQLIETNRDRLANPDDPDLIFANQVFELPPFDAG